ncbi:MAG: hypothetical protein H6737_23065 [Alphaproteobacteria bacterium]|nr:hypothetical protein [Alphaproteobacteria bacterium]
MKLLLPATLVALLLACTPDPPQGVTETGNPELDAQLRVTAYSTAPAQVGVDAPSGTLSVGEAWLAIDRVRFVRGAVCDAPGEIEIDADGPFVRDAAEPVPEPIAARLPSDDYCRIRLRLEPAPTAGPAPAELVGHTVLVSGVRADGTPWTARTTEDFDIDIRAAAPIALDAASEDLLVALDVATWLDGIDLDSAVVTNGAIFIETGSNEPLLAAIETRLEAAFELYDDADGDGEIDD